MEHIRDVFDMIKRLQGFSNYDEIAVFMGVPVGRIKYLATTSKKGFEGKEIDFLVEKYRLNPVYLITGEGDHYLNGLGGYTERQGLSWSLAPDTIKVPIMSAVTSGSKLINGIEHFEVEANGVLTLDRMLFKILPQLDNIQAVRVRGDSMNPTLREDDYVVIELEEQFSGDGIYVLSWDGILLVKRLQAGNMIIKVLSDNQSFESMEYNPTEDQRTFHIIGKVILRIQR